jgi:hypothetical protein
MDLAQISSYVLFYARPSSYGGYCVYDGRADVALNELSAVLDEARRVRFGCVVGGDGAIDSAAEPGVIGGYEGEEGLGIGLG